MGANQCLEDGHTLVDLLVGDVRGAVRILRRSGRDELARIADAEQRPVLGEEPPRLALRRRARVARLQIAVLACPDEAHESRALLRADGHRASSVSLETLEECGVGLRLGTDPLADVAPWPLDAIKTTRAAAATTSNPKRLADFMSLLHRVEAAAAAGGRQEPSGRATGEAAIPLARGHASDVHACLPPVLRRQAARACALSHKERRRSILARGGR